MDVSKHTLQTKDGQKINTHEMLLNMLRKSAKTIYPVMAGAVTKKKGITLKGYDIPYELLEVTLKAYLKERRASRPPSQPSQDSSE
eukprot:gene790-60_t